MGNDQRHLDKKLWNHKEEKVLFPEDKMKGVLPKVLIEEDYNPIVNPFQILKMNGFHKVVIIGKRLSRNNLIHIPVLGWFVIQMVLEQDV